MNKRLLKNGFSFAYYHLYRQFVRERGYRILLYHSVGSDIPYDAYGISISPDLFRSQLDLINGEYEVVPLSAKMRDNGLVITFDDGYRDNLYVAARELQQRSMPFTVFVTTSYIQSGSRIYLAREELRELASFEGTTIGSHGMTHRPLTGCDDANLWDEVHGSKCYLEDLLGKPVTAISYPHGMADRRVRDAALRTGYTVGACSLFGVNTAGRDVMLLRRTEVLATDSERIFAGKIKGASDWYGWVQTDPAFIG